MISEDKIVEKIEEAREFFDIKNYPSNFFNHIVCKKSVFDKYGIFLFKQEMGKTSGFIGYTDDNVPIICINYKRNIGHQNFTLAHEIGHYFLHIGQNICDSDKEIHSFYNNEEVIEHEANIFAQELIYPIAEAKKDYQTVLKRNLFGYGNEEKLADFINDLCKKYIISFKFAFYRLCLTENKFKFNIKSKLSRIKKTIGNYSEKYENYMHIVVPQHEFYKPYSQEYNVLNNNIEHLIKKEEISLETGEAIINRNAQIEGAKKGLSKYGIFE